MNIRICYIHRAGYPQIGCTSFFEYAQKASLHNLDVSVICTRDNRKAQEHASGSRTKVYEVPVPDLGRRGTLAFVSRAAAIVQEIQPHIVHCFHFRGVSILAFLLRRHNACPRFLLDIRSGHLRVGIKGSIGRLANYLETFPFDSIAFISPDIKPYAVGNRRLRQPTFYFPLGVDWQAFAHGGGDAVRTNLYLPENALIGVYAGILSPMRDLSRVIRAIEKTIEEIPGFHFLFLGDGPDLAKLRSLGEELGIGKHLHFLGFIPYSRIADYYHVAQIGLSYVPMSPQFANQPVLKVVEYMAAGLATVATNTPGHRRVIKDAHNGVLVEDTPEAIASGIIEIARNVNTMKRMGANAQNTARQYDWQYVYQEHIMPAYKHICVTPPRNSA